MRTATIKSLKLRLEKLCADKVRARYKVCRACKMTGNDLETAHIVSKKHARTRFVLENLLLLHHSCHMYFHDHPAEFIEFVKKEIGLYEYERLVREGNKTQMVTKAWLEEILEKLEQA